MAGQTARSLKLSRQGIQKADIALQKFAGKRDLAAQLGMSPTTVTNFFQGQNVLKRKFHQICKKLKLDWQEVAELSSQVEPELTEKLNDISQLDKLVQQVRERLHDNIQCLHGKMPLWGVDSLVPLSDLYVDVNILESLSSNRRDESEDFWKDFQENLQWHSSYRSLDRIGLGQDAGRRSGLEILKREIKNKDGRIDYPKFMVVGKPGSGKTTYLQRIVTECNEGRLQAHCIPELIRLRYFVDDGCEFDYSIKAYLTQQWRISEIETDLILSEGRALVLFDGLDEVAGENGKKIAAQIKGFARKYPRTQSIVTCRTQSHNSHFDWKSLGFSYIEVADFNEEQIQKFVRSWFQSITGEVSVRLVTAQKLLTQLFEEENKTIRDLAVTPILLSLICNVFHKKRKLYSKRYKLYEEGLQLLLERWDESRDIKRDEIYLGLSSDQKAQLLSYVAVKKFEQPKYVVFEQEEIEGYIAEFLQITQQESRFVLQALEWHHGLLIQRSDTVWSFSHLTFQEYFVAKWFCCYQNLKGAIHNVTKEYWQEVFILIAERENIADTLLDLICEYIFEFLKTKNDLEVLLRWVGQKSSASNFIYKKASSRAFCFVVAIFFASARYADIKNKNHESLDYFFIELDEFIDGFLKNEFEVVSKVDPRFNIDRTNENLDIDLCFIRVFARLDYIFRQERDLFLHYGMSMGDLEGEFYHDLIDWIDKELFFEVSLKNAFYHDFISALQLLKNKLPPSCQEDDDGKFQKWWSECGDSWFKDFVFLAKQHRNLPFEWLSCQDDSALSDYYTANKLLVNCLNYGSPKIRQKVEENLFLPIAEIEKRKLL